MDRWNEYYFGIAEVVSRNSRCHSRKIGAILVKDRSIISTGYNGPPRGVPHCGEERVKLDIFLRKWMFGTFEPRLQKDLNGCPRKAMGFKSGEGLDYCIAAHAEQNCIANAARMGIRTLDSTLYMNDQIPCKNCMAILINAGVKEVVVTKLELYDGEGEYLAKYGGLKIRTFEGEVWK